MLRHRTRIRASGRHTYCAPHYLDGDVVAGDNADEHLPANNEVWRRCREPGELPSHQRIPSGTSRRQPRGTRRQSQMDLDRITRPLRLAKGSHQPESGMGCAMNAISYIAGDTQITDFPATSARPLAAFVQLCNDLLAGPAGYLRSENNFLALELGWQTVGTAEVPDNVVHAWVAELLTSPSWGVVQYVENAAPEAIFDTADLHGAIASCAVPAIPPW